MANNSNETEISNENIGRKDRDKTVYILDSYGLIFRCYFAFISRPLTNPKGENISALFGFFRNFHYILEHYKPSYIIAAMDSTTKTFRHEFYPEYKATRNKTPDDLHAQVPWISEILESMGIPVLQCDGYEADDIIATVAKKCEENGRECRILSGDKDLMQLVTENTNILKPENGGGWKLTKSDGVEAEWGVKPEQLLDLLSLYGDTADNIPGVRGIGVKTASALLNEYQNLDGIYSHIDEIKGAVQKKLAEGKENAYFSQKLVRLDNEVPCGSIDEALENPIQFNFSKAAALLKNYGAFAVSKSYKELALKNGEQNELNEGLFAESTNNESGESDVLFSDKKESGKKLVSEASLPPATNTVVSMNSTTAFSATPSSGDTPQHPDFIEPEQNHGDYKAVTDFSELSAFIDNAVAKKIVAFDSETNSLDTLNCQIVGFSLCLESGKAIYVPLYSANLFDSLDFIPKEKALAELKRLFDNPEVSVILHNGKFDLKVLYSNGISFSGGKPSCRIIDTMVAAWLLSPDKLGKNSYSLEYLAEKYIHLKGIEYDEIVPKGQTFADLELEKAVPYAAEDADFTFQLWFALEKLLKEQNLFELFAETEMKVLPVLYGMETEGIHLDKSALHEYNKELTEKIEEAEKAIYKEVGHEFNVASPMQLQTVLFEERKLKPGKKTKRGYSTDTAVLEELSMYDSVPKMILEFRELAKLKSTYVETLPNLCDKNDRIHTDFVQTGTATGRLSSREPNLQNIPVRNEAGRRIRSAFTAPEGKILISADYSQIELVVLAHLSGDKNMRKAFTEGEDVHKSTAALIYGVPKDEVTPEMRRTAKTINFGVIYGMSAFRLANDLGISRTEAASFIENYDRLYSDITRFKTETIMKAEETGFVETIFGRKRYIMNIRSRNKFEKSAAERIAVNTPIQGSAADIVKKAMIDVDSALHKKNNGAKILLQVHDELITECPDEPETIAETIEIIKNRMENAVKLSIPLRVSVESGKAWGEFH